MKTGYVYLMTNKINTVIYTGVTSNLEQRIHEHRAKLVPGFTRRYNITKLVYYEQFEDIQDALQREKQIKGGSRTDKISLIESLNPQFKDLYEEL